MDFLIFFLHLYVILHSGCQNATALLPNKHLRAMAQVENSEEQKSFLKKSFLSLI